MKKLINVKIGIVLAIGIFCCVSAIATLKDDKQVSGVPSERQSFSIIVDDEGVMRRSDTGEEVSYYGTNYTVPFAHAFRALDYLEIDHKETIRKDVADMARLGFNGFRIHLWDSELADSAGNLLDNKHLDLLDFLIAELQKRNIDVILTAQTNFGNGYPERDIDTGAFTYDFPKCGIHEDPTARKIQQNYLKQLMQHVNSYNGLSYAENKGIIAVEINNEPCHTGTPEEVTEYINLMKDALRSAGFDRIVLYNVSHNDDVRSAYYNADIQGTTFQWYPSGLVAGHERKGNFLPAVAEYNIPWKDNMPNYNRLARVVYEFDPGDILGSYLYPAIARTFRKEGFQWITQFTYDPTPLAPYNTEYQTHYLNLAYTPAKAISMMIAGEAARNIPRNSDYGAYPRNNQFDNFLVDYEQDLSLLNSSEKFYFSNSTDIAPVNVDSLTKIAGHGSSPVVSYNGSGAYFLDKVNDSGVWRLEVMPDVTLIEDPFKKHDLSHKISEVAHRKQNITIDLPQLGSKFIYKGINEGNIHSGNANNGTIDVSPGVYLLAKERGLFDLVDLNSRIDNVYLCEYHAPSDTQGGVVPKFNFPSFADIDDGVSLTVDIVSSEKPDSIVIYPSDISFWRKDNNLIKMNTTDNSHYKATIGDKRNKDIKFRVTVFKNGTSTTYPGKINRTPLDWDFPESDYFVIKRVSPEQPVYLFNAYNTNSHYDLSTVPSGEYGGRSDYVDATPMDPAQLLISYSGRDGSSTVWRTFVGDIIDNYPYIKEMCDIIFEIKDSSVENDSLTFCVLDKGGATFGMSYKDALSKGYVESLGNGVKRVVLPIKELKPSDTYLIPEPFPSFMHRKIKVDSAFETEIDRIEFVEIRHENSGKEDSVSLYSVWLAPNYIPL